MTDTVKSCLPKIMVLLFISLSCICPLVVPAIPPVSEEDSPSWAPDSQRLVYECYLEGPAEGGNNIIGDEASPRSYYTLEAADICISDINQHNQERLVSDSGGDWHPIWSPDGSQIVYSRRDGIYLITPDGQDQRQLLPPPYTIHELSGRPGKTTNMTWSPNGDHLLLSACLDHSDLDIYVIDADTGTVTNLTPGSRSDDFHPMWTLDGTKIAFLSADSTDTSSIYDCGGDLPYQDLSLLKVMNADGSEQTVVSDRRFDYPFLSISNSGLITFKENETWRRIDLEGRPVDLPTTEQYFYFLYWSPNEEYLAYESYPNLLKVLNVKTGETLESQIERNLTQWDTSILIDDFVWSPDSQKIAVTTSTHGSYAVGTEQHIYVFDVQTATATTLIQE